MKTESCRFGAFLMRLAPVVVAALIVRSASAAPAGFFQQLYSGSYVKTGDPETEGIVVDAAGLTFAGNSYTYGGVTYKVGDNTTAAYVTYMLMRAGKTYRFAKNYDDNGLVRIIDPNGTANDVIDHTTWSPIVCAHYTASQTGIYRLDLRVGNGTGGVGPSASPMVDVIKAGLAWTDSEEVTDDTCTAENAQYWKRFENPAGEVIFFTGGTPAGMIQVKGVPSDFGTVSPAYGLPNIATNGTPTEFTIVERRYEDGNQCAVGGDGHRAFIESCEIFTNGLLAASSPMAPIIFTAPAECDSLVAEWTFTNEQWRTVVATADAGGTVSIGGVTGSPVTNWTESGSSVSLVATPDSTHSFSMWTGDTDGIDMYAKSQRIDATRARTLTATWTEKRDPVTTSWTGGAGDGEWTNVDNWDNGIPAAGDTAILSADAAMTICLSATMPELGKLVISNAADATTTLISSNWFTKIRATDLVVGKGGIITCGGPFQNAEMSNRVWITATTLTVEEGGRIDVDQKGYSYTNGPCWTAAILADSQYKNTLKFFGAAYGGRQGLDGMQQTVYDGYFGEHPEPVPYGNAAAPLDPGSGGGTDSSGNTGYPGGGAVRIDVAGALKVDGVITANGGKIRPGCAGGASGGGIYMTCQTVSGAGSVTANGGGYDGAQNQGGGSGGRVAVLYDAAAQASTDCSVRFEARSGCRTLNNRANGIREPGTLYFTDNQFLTSAAYLADGWKFAGRWMSAAGAPTSLEIDGDLTLPSAQLAFTAAPLALDVTGDLTVTGAINKADISWFSNATITVGGDLKVDSSRLELYGGSLAVAGDMLLQTNTATRTGSELVVRAAATNDPAVACGATVSVDGTSTLGKYAMISPWAHDTNGAVVRFTFGDFVLDQDASVDANEKGYRNKYGPGKPTSSSSCVGASHGGRGGSISESAKIAEPCDSETYPVQPGSGANCDGWHGGGAVLMSATRTMTLNGTVTANGNASVQFWYCGTAGGTVNLSAPVVSGTTGTVTAKGGNRNDWDKGSFGGGGRIALGYRQDKTDGVTFCVDPLDQGKDPQYAEAGTIYKYMLPPQPNTFTISATPEEVGESEISPGYGDILALSPGQKVLCTASESTFDIGSSKCSINGWKLYETDADNNLTLVDEATTNAYCYVHENGKMYRFVWQIVRAYAVTFSSNEPDGAEVYAGAQKLVVGENYVPESDAVVFRADTESGYSVFCWSGPDFDDVQSSSITLPVHAERSLSLVLMNDNHEPSAATWQGTAGGKWTDLANWQDSAFPQKGDAVTIGGSTAQTVTLGVSTPRLGSLVVSNGSNKATKLLLSNWDTRVSSDAVTVGAGGVIAVEGAFKDTEMSNRVYLAGATLNVAAGGKILADQAGYARRCGPGWVGASSGSNHAISGQRNEFAGSYGGNQAFPIEDGRWADHSLVPPHTYGSASAPLDPGCGGGEYAGGGAIRLDFTGAVTIDGLVSAAGQTAALNTGGTGSGGAIYITCASIAGTGEVKANGRDAALNNALNNYGGSGGRVSVVYDPTAQDAADCRVRFEARGGITYTMCGDATNGSGTSFVPDIISEDGTLYFTDSRFLTSGYYRENGLKFAGQWAAPLDGDTVDFGDDDLFLDRTHLVFPEGVSVVAGGNVVMEGYGPRPAENGLIVSNANVTIGGNLTLRDARVELRGGDLTVGGDLVQELKDNVAYTDNDYWKRTTGGGELCFHPAPTNGTANAVGARMHVGGSWTMSAGAATYPFSHPTDGAVVAMEVVRDFTLTTNAYVNGDMRGYAGFYGPGRKEGSGYYGMGPSHGGKGSYSASDPSQSNKLADVYGDYKRPVTPGTGAAGGDDYGSCPAPGGSAIFLTVGHAMTLNGYIGACGTTDNFVRYWQSASSGGSIYLKTWKLRSGSPTVTAKGGIGNRHGYGYGIGGGGRVALWYASHDIADFEAYKENFTAEKGKSNSSSGGNTAEDGTVYFHRYGGFVFLVR